MSSFPLRVACVSALALVGVLAACGGEIAPGGTSSSTDVMQPTVPRADPGNNNGEAEGIGYGCCTLPASPPTCSTQGSLGGTKPSADGACPQAYDAVTDPSAPGWKVDRDANNCPIWTPPAGAQLVFCDIEDASVPPPDADTDAGGP